MYFYPCNSLKNKLAMKVCIMKVVAMVPPWYSCL